jgi:CDP-4-dehydro-6-deoxyglucose reductase
MFGFLKKKQKDFKANVIPAGDVLEVKSGESLLKAALAAGLDWPHDCRVGSCGTCRCHLREGKIKELSDFSYVLDGDELKEGMILACQTQLKGDIVVEVDLGAGEDMAMGLSTINGQIAITRWLTHDIMAVTIKLDKPFPHVAEPDVHQHGYRAGQYADISFPGIEKPRSYSFAKAPENEGKNELTFFVRKVPNGELTTWLFAKDRVGSPVTVTGPFGSFWLREGEGPIICVAGGSGMSSIMALLEHASNTGCKRDAVYLFGARTQKDLYCLDELKALESAWSGSGGTLRFLPVLSEEPEDSDWQGLRGLVTEQIAALPLDWAKTQAYLCGPPPMIDAAIEVLKHEGVSKEDIHFDKFLDASSMPGGRH